MNTKFKKNIDKVTAQLKYKSNKAALVSLENWANDENISDYRRLLDLCSYYRYDFLNISFYESVLKNDPQIFNDGLFLYNRIQIKSMIKIADGSADLSHFKYILEAFAGNDFKVIYQIYPKDKEAFQGKQRAFPQAVSNLLLGIVQKNHAIITQGKKDALRCLRNKNGNYEIALINYLLAVIDKNITQISFFLNEVCKHYRSARWLHDYNNPLSKIIALDIYGLYNITRYYLDNDRLSKVKFAVSNGLVWEKFTKIATSGKPSIQFTGVLTPLNQLYTI